MPLGCGQSRSGKPHHSHWVEGVPANDECCSAALVVPGRGLPRGLASGSTPLRAGHFRSPRFWDGWGRSALEQWRDGREARHSVDTAQASCYIPTMED